MRTFWFGTLICLFTTVGHADAWKDHRKDIDKLERAIYKFQQEMDVLVESKKNSRDRARIEETLSRIVEIHAELISLRKKMDNTRAHLKLEHPDKVSILDDLDSRTEMAKRRKRRSTGPLARQLDQLLIKVQLKFSSFIGVEEQREEVKAAEKMVQEKRKVKREREADVYLRKKSKVRLEK